MQTLKANRLRLEKFVYDKGTNVALYNAEHHKIYREFEARLYRALLKQIITIARNDNFIDSILLLSKAATPAAEQQVSVFLGAVALTDEVDVSAYLVWAGEQGGQAALDKLAINGIFGLKNPDLINYFDDSAKLLITSVDDYTKEWIANQIQEGKTNMLTPYEIAQKMVDESDEFSQMRAKRIVLTETATAMTKVELEAATRYGIQEKIWRTSNDDRVDPICSDLEGARVGIKQSFPGGYEGPPAHPNCRCFIEEVIPEAWTPPQNAWLGE